MLQLYRRLSVCTCKREVLSVRSCLFCLSLVCMYELQNHRFGRNLAWNAYVYVVWRMYFSWEWLLDKLISDFEMCTKLKNVEDLGTRWGRVSGQLHFTAALLLGKYPVHRRIAGPQSRSECSGSGEEKNILHFPWRLQFSVTLLASFSVPYLFDQRFFLNFVGETRLKRCGLCWSIVSLPMFFEHWYFECS
jgi:hypothetical protein